MRTHHARIYTPCRAHGEHTLHLISRDDFSHITAGILAKLIKAEGYDPRVTVWIEGDRHVHSWAEGQPVPFDDEEMPF